MRVALEILLVLFCVQGLVKLSVGFLVPYSTRIQRIAIYYQNDARIISLYDDIVVVLVVVMVGLLLVTGVESVSFVTGLVCGMLLIQVFFHRFKNTLGPDRTPGPGAPPNKIMSYAIQDRPSLAWREVSVMTVLFLGALYALGSAIFGSLV